VLEMGMVGSPRAVAAGTLATKTDGAGPYMLDPAKTVARDHYTYVRNPHYWNREAQHWDEVVIKTISNPTAALQALKTGQVQVAKDQPISNIAAAESAGLRYVDPLTLLMSLSLMDRDGRVVKPLADLRVRQAINHAIDRRAIAGALGSGHAQPTVQMAVPGDDSYDAALEQRYPYDLAKARALLADAGYPDGFRLPVLSLAAVGQDQMAQALAGQLEKVGIELELDVKATNDEYVKGLSSGRYPAATLSFGRVPAAIDYQLLWGPDAALFNPFRATSPRLDALDARLDAASGEEAPAIARRMQAVTVDDAWYAPVFASPLVVVHSDDVAGVVATPERSVVYTPEIKPAD
ncbi:MAG TPA: ABC transporter substrate-binding protein, partial [Conexibacter sp.]|nr:ABC transporter substrate-binding protein [Conexibacter sp.]